MITNYYRPQTIEEALNLLAQPETIPLGGGTKINSPMFNDRDFSVVDLQVLGMNQIHKRGNNLEIGSTVTLQQLIESEHIAPALAAAIKLEAPINLRNMATVAGTLITCDGRSTFAAAMLALDARLSVVSSGLTDNHQPPTTNIGDFLPLRSKGLITTITIPLNVKFAFEQVARTPSDKPIVCAALTQWNSGRTRLALGGFGKSPTLAMDGGEADGIETAARNAYHEAGDEIASAEYRMDVAATLARRLGNWETR
jgi:CO/xanthine dehydrogenase FAD-binding subunit